MANDFYISALCDLYGNLLTERQKSAVVDYYDRDLSLGEIAENLSITRQAVRDALLKAERLLSEYEEKLGFYSRIKKTTDTLKACRVEMEKGGGEADALLKRAEAELTGE